MKNKLTKEEFLEKLKTDRDFNNRYGRKHITEGKMVLPPCHYGFQVYTRELSKGERLELLSKAGGGQHQTLGVNSMVYNPEFEMYNIPTRAISLMFNMRSNDVPLGLPFNIASYGLLLEIIAKMVNMVPDELIGNLGDCHIYTNQIEGVEEQLTRKPFELTTLQHQKTNEFYKSLSEDLTLLTHLEPGDFVLNRYQSHSKISMPLSN